MSSSRSHLAVLVLLASLSACSLNAEGAGDNPSSQSSASSGGGGSNNGGGGNGGSGNGGGATEPTGPIRYPLGLRHSPFAKSVVDRAKGVLASAAGRKDIFAKVGDSNTVNTGFLNCFAGGDVKLAANGALQPTIDYFKKTLADGTNTSFNRTTLAAKVGWASDDLLFGNPSPTEQEIAAITPAFAVVMLGTNDTFLQGVEPFGNNMLEIVDTLMANGIVPFLTTIPQRTDSTAAAAMVPEMNAIVRAVAQAKQIPMLDLFGGLAGIAEFGLANDGIHLQNYTDMGTSHPCWLGAAVLTQGMNQRNLITLEALDRARRFLIESETPEQRPAELGGEGTWQAPYEIDALPFVDNRDTTGVQTSVANKYSCSMANESGPEIVYRLKLETTKNLRIRVIDDQNGDIDVQFMADPGGADNCLARGDKVLDVTAAPGTYWISADTFVDAAMNALPGTYLLTVVER